MVWKPRDIKYVACLKTCFLVANKDQGLQLEILCSNCCQSYNLSCSCSSCGACSMFLSFVHVAAVEKKKYFQILERKLMF